MLRIADVLRRIAEPILLFLFVLVILLALSAVLFLPLLTRVEVHGNLIQGAELRKDAEALLAKVVRLEEQRLSLLNPLRDTSIAPLLDRQRRSMRLLLLTTDVLNRGKAIAHSAKSMNVTSLQVDASRNAVVVTGDIRNVGTRSMTVLAQFVESIRRNPRVSTVDLPSFQRLDDPVIGAYSPFSFRISSLP